MLNENIKTLRKNKGFTQDELASRLDVVRQTVSKWEKGYSVPDAELLKKIADIFETDVSTLLGSPIAKDASVDIVAEQLSRINEQLAMKNRRSHKIWKTIGIVFLVFIVLHLILIITSAVAFSNYKFSSQTPIEQYSIEKNEHTKE
ncbi:MAG: helix-turn-helix transcriptional regulator [Lachnospiraceae bacterium]|nr:helix-turn-helix transcriptional regulator [Lachnospiraceae bacterium]